MEPDLSGIRWRITGRYALISGFVLLTFGLAVFVEVSRARAVLLREQVRQLASSAAAQMPLILHETQEYKLINPRGAMAEAAHVALLDPQSAALGSKKIVLFDKQMQILSQYGSMPLNLQAPRPRRGLDQRQDLVVPHGVAYWRPVYLRETAGAASELEGYVLTAVSTLSTDREMLRLRNGLLVGGSVGALVAALLSQWMVGTSLKPIRDQIQRLVRFTGDASHELRHPLTAIRAVIGSVRERGLLERAEPELAQKLQLIDEATDDMSRLVDDLLLLTRLDRVVPDQNHWRRFDLCDLAEDLLALHQDRASSERITLQPVLQRPAWIHGNPDQMRRLISNLLVNALQVSPAGGTVQLRVEQRGHHLAVEVDDEGPGIPAEQRSLVFERFWQADAARSGANAGLGLSIARSIALVHGGSIEAQASNRDGCRMVVQLPSRA